MHDTRRTFLHGLRLAALLAIPALPATAAEVHCVDTVAELENALAGGMAWSTPSSDPPEALEIRVVAGTYAGVTFPYPDFYAVCPFLTPCDFHQYLTFGDLSIVGGWNASCTGRTRNAGATRLIAEPGELLRIYSRGNLVIEGFSLEGFETDSGTDFMTFDPGAELLFRGNRILGWDGSVSFVGAESGDLRFEGNLVRSVDPGDIHPSEPAALSLRPGTGGRIDVSHNTIVDNAGYGLAVNPAGSGIGSIFEPGVAVLVNNIVWGHGGLGSPFRDIVSAVIETTLVHNTFQSFEGDSPELEIGTSHQDPGFVLVGGSYELRADSPALHSATNWIPSGIPDFDLNGDPRPVGSGLDRGAYERQTTALPVTTVTSLGNSGAGTLRQAILNANANPDMTRIVFDLPAACKDNVIPITSPLPDLLTSIVIDGYSQPGSRRNRMPIGNDSVLCVGVRASGAVSRALEMPENLATTLKVQVHGLAFGGFDDDAVRLASGSGHVVSGNRFGLGPGGDLGGTTFFSGNRRHLILASGTSRALVGGAEPGARNVFAFADEEAIHLLSPALGGDEPSGGHFVVNNYIGTGRTGATAGGNGRGILVTSAENLLRGNTIGGNELEGIVLRTARARDNRIESNRIGYRATIDLGVPLELPNGSHGLLLENGPRDNLFVGNAVAHNLGAGFRIESGGNNRISGNRTHSNAELGIDLDQPGVDAIDNDGAALPASLANRRLNRPVIVEALGFQGLLRVEGVLHSTNSLYKIRAFSSASCDDTGGAGTAFGEGAAPHGAATALIDDAPAGQNGQATFATDWMATGYAVASARFVTVTASDSEGDTSEYSECVPVVEVEIFSDGLESGDLSAWGNF